MTSSRQISSFDGDYADIVEHIRKDKSQCIVFTNGCFDILHPGHLDTLDHARSLAGLKGKVVVGINSDKSVKKLKGNSRPVFDEMTRGRMLMSLRQVDHVVVFDEDTPWLLIDALRPHVIVKGGDYDKESVVGKEVALVSIAELRSGWSTSKIIEKIRSAK
jgi:D-beta-D-heptose 7-phosphate kinase/D-beta-D-heptose 1-phosphate adenosyltransferase